MACLFSAMDYGYGIGSNKNGSAEAEPVVNSDPFQPFILLEDFENEEQSKTLPDAAIEGFTPDGMEICKSPSSATSSSSESNSTIADGFQFCPMVFPDSNNSDPQSSPKSEENAIVHKRDVKSDVSIAALLSLEKIYGSSNSISQVSDVTRESTFPILSETQSPPVQIMERAEGYDPNRIPASAFISGSSTPIDWSANSNDSLFSIQIGNSSLAREQFAGAESAHFLTSEESQKWKESYKSGELCKSNELHGSAVVKISNQVTVLGQNSPVSREKEDKPEGLGIGKNGVLLTDQQNDIPYRNIKVEDKANQGYKNRKTNHHCDETGTSNQSSASPTWCCCSGSLCWSYKWSYSPSFCCKWASCSACSLKCHSPDCSFCKYAKRIFCCSSSEGLRDGKRRKWWSCCCPCSCFCPCSSCSYSCC